MIDALVLAAVAYAGYAAAPAWWALVGAAMLTIANWWTKLRLLRQHPRVPLSTKMTTYLVVSIGINLGFAAASLLVGRILARLLQD